MTKILLVEDDKSLREIYGTRLLAEGYDIVSAGDGEEALTNAINEHPDLIVSDLMMPKISGFEMIDLLRTNDQTKNVKIIVMSALGGESQKERGRELGADRYLVKSQVGIEDLVAVVKEVLSEGKPAQPSIQPNQSAINPVQATDPSGTSGQPAPKLPDVPQQIPTIMTNPLAQQKPADDPVPVVAAPAPIQNPAPETQSLPPIPLPTPSMQSTTSSPAPATLNAATASQTVPAQAPIASTAPTMPTVMPQQPVATNQEATAVGGIKVIQPTGESLSPKVDIDALLAKEGGAPIISPEMINGATTGTVGATSDATPLDANSLSANPDGIVNVNSSQNSAE